MSLRAKRTGWWLALLVAGLGVCPWAALVHAAEIKVLSAGAMKGIVTELAETFRQETGNTVLWPGGYAAEAIVKGQAELCVHQISEILPVKGVTLVGPLPRELQKITTYSAAVATRAATPETARAFIAFVTRPTFKPKFVVAGLDYRE